MIQYKDASVGVFEGYAGSSKSGFRAEVEAQRALGQIDDILDYFDDRRAGGLPSGPAGPRVARALDATADTLGPLPAMIADRARLGTLLASLARTLHIGPHANCFFDPSTALCLKQATAPDRTTPLIALCAPTRGPNACITQRHRPAWERVAADAALLLCESGCQSRNGSCSSRSWRGWRRFWPGSVPSLIGGLRRRGEVEEG